MIEEPPATEAGGSRLRYVWINQYKKSPYEMGSYFFALILPVHILKPPFR